MKTCNKCNSELNGVMVFYPKLCLDCVVDLHCDDNLDEPINEVKKAFEKQKNFINHKIIKEKA